ncbi:hypothetical protein PIB30_113003 [Stylosanthes scabra]|uniref:Uncharacterized protein n=1 Tax=Stylosanthes scabra TaxID=79078 RepID=A0ABU6VZG4_9FABA|nr:hypothetical protein [Stylosanthes scabra]
MAAESVEYSTQLRLKIQEFVEEVKCSPSHAKKAHISRKGFMFNEPSYSDTHLSQVDEIQDHQIHSPVKVNRKGRPRAKRIMSTCEKVVNKSVNKNKRLRKEASIEEVLALNGGSKVQLESSIEVAFGMDNNDRCGQVLIRSTLHLEL